VLFDEIHQEFNSDEGNDERHDGPQQQSENFRSRESAVLQYELDDFYKTRAEHDGNGEKKGKFRGGGAGEPIYITKNGEGDLVVMSIEAFEQREEALKLRAKLEAAEQGRLAGAPAYTLEDSRKRLEEIYRRG